MIQVVDEEGNEGNLTLYEMSPAQPILPVIVEALSIDESNTYKIQITHIETNTVTEAEIIAADVKLNDEFPEIETVAHTTSEEILVSETTDEKPKRKVKSVKKNASQIPEFEPVLDATVSSEAGIKTNPAPDLLSCMICGKNFVSIGRLQSHEKTHSKTRPFKCIDCGKTFTVRYSLICHTRVHTRERPYSCTVCGSRFSQASSLKTHQIYKHTKDFPYSCKICGRGFISPGQRHEHVSRSHQKSVSGRKKSPAKKKQLSTNETEEVKKTSPPEMLTACVQTNLTVPPGTIF